MPKLSRAHARERVTTFDWSRIDADPDDVQRIRESLEYLVDPDEDTKLGHEDAFGDLMDALQYVDRSEEGTAPLLGLLLELATCVEQFDEPERFVSEVSCVLRTFPKRNETGPISNVIRQHSETLKELFHDASSTMRRQVAILVAMANQNDWRERLERELDRTDDPELRAHLTLALVEMGIEYLEPLGIRLAHQANDDWRLQRAAAVCLRLAASRDPTVITRLPTELITFADEHGQPGWLEQLYRDVFPLEMPVALQSRSTLTPPGPYEPAEVLFASASMLVVKHVSRGNFTLKVPNTGLQKGEMVELSGFVPPPYNTVRRLRYHHHGTTHEVDF
jgi:hypothetical protein